MSTLSFVFIILLLISVRKCNSLTRNHVLVQKTYCNNTATSTAKHNPHIRHLHICVCQQHLAQHEWTYTVTVTLPSKLSSIIVKCVSSKSCGWTLAMRAQPMYSQRSTAWKWSIQEPTFTCAYFIAFVHRTQMIFPMYCRNIQYAYSHMCLFTTIRMYGCLNNPFAKC